LVQTALEAVRGLAVQVNVYGPVIQIANIAFTISVYPGYSKSVASGLAQTAVTNFLNSRPLGSTIVPRTRIAQVAYDAVAGIANVVEESILINNQAADLVLNYAQVVKSGVVVIG
jgi:hypothetical protein